MVNTRRVLRTGVAVGLVAASAAGGLGFRHYTASARQVVAAPAQMVSQVTPACSPTGKTTLEFKSLQNKVLFTFDVRSLDYGAKQTLNIGTQTSGVGAGKATLDEIDVVKTSDVQDSGLLAALGAGTAGIVTITIYSPQTTEKLVPCRTIYTSPTAIKSISHHSEAGSSTEKLAFQTGCMVITEDGHSDGWNVIRNVRASTQAACATSMPTLK